MEVKSNNTNKFLEQENFLRNRVGKEGALIGVIAALGCFVFSLFLTWSQARSAIDLEDKGYATGWSESGYLAIMPLIWVVYSIVRNNKIRPRTVIAFAILSFSILIFINVANRAEWIYREYTTTMGNYGGSWRNYTGRNHSSGSDLGLGFWFGLISLSAVSVFSLIWSLHRILEVVTEKVRSDVAEVTPTVIVEQPQVAPVIPKQASYQNQSNPDMSPYEKLNELAKLKDRGVITPDEFQQQKAIILGTKPARGFITGKKGIAFSVAVALVALLIIGSFLSNRVDQSQQASNLAGNSEGASNPDPVVSTVDQQTASTEIATPSAPTETASTNSQSTLTNVGECKATLIASISNRLEDEPESGSAITYSDGTFGVSYETIAGVVNSRVDDPINICLESVPQNCPAGDERGKVYKATNLRTNETWSLPDSSHSCGGA